jgi:hypothetical protein
VWHVRTIDGDTGLDEHVQTQVDAIHTFYAALASNAGFTDGIFATGTTFEVGNVVDVETSEPHPVTWTTVTQTTTLADAAPALQICVGWKTTSATRRGTGRTFLGPLNAGCVAADGSMASDRRGTVLTAAQAIVTHNLADDFGAVCIWGLQTKGGTPASPHVGRDITGRKVGNQLAVLRSRRD